jgi:tRNA (cytidine/uridine-2'-O-)-methyltransferase
MLHIVLYEPEIPPNTGNAIRLCANSGARLHLIRPLGFRLSDKGLKRSGLDYHDLAQLRIHEDLDACIAALNGARIMAVETGGHVCYADFKFCAGDALVFGPETRGLPDAVRARIGHENSLFIPMQPRSRSLNLSNAVALVAYEAWRQLGFIPSPSAPLAP